MAAAPCLELDEQELSAGQVFQHCSQRLIESLAGLAAVAVSQLTPLVKVVEVDEWLERSWEGLTACHVTGQGQQVLHRWVLGLVDYLVGLPAVHCLQL